MGQCARAACCLLVCSAHSSCTDSESSKHVPHPGPPAVKLEQLGSSALPASSGNGATLMETMALAGAPAQQRNTAAGASLPPGLPPLPASAPAPTPAVVAAGVMSAGGTELSTGLTPHVGGLELPPGIEGIVPSNQPLTGGCVDAVGGCCTMSSAAACAWALNACNEAPALCADWTAYQCT